MLPRKLTQSIHFGLQVSRIRYLQVFENERVSIGLFLLHNGAELPLHNHPGMTVVRCRIFFPFLLGVQLSVAICVANASLARPRWSLLIGQTLSTLLSQAHPRLLSL